MLLGKNVQVKEGDKSAGVCMSYVFIVKIYLRWFKVELKKSNIFSSVQSAIAHHNYYLLFWKPIRMILTSVQVTQTEAQVRSV